MLILIVYCYSYYFNLGISNPMFCSLLALSKFNEGDIYNLLTKLLSSSYIINVFLYDFKKILGLYFISFNTYVDKEITVYYIKPKHMDNFTSKIKIYHSLSLLLLYFNTGDKSLFSIILNRIGIYCIGQYIFCLSSDESKNVLVFIIHVLHLKLKNDFRK